jgi:hypothetical protein
VIGALKELFLKHGPPLVLKSDNGSGFIAAETIDLLAQQEVIPLFSPPRRPQYNGGCERGGGILKGYTHAVAVRAGRAGVCLPADLEQARQSANTLSRPWGHTGPSPDDVWRARSPILPEQRAAFQAEVAQARIAACAELEYRPDQPLTRSQAARRDRRAVQVALTALGYLKLVPRRDPLLRQPPHGPVSPAAAAPVASAPAWPASVSPAPSAQPPAPSAPAEEKSEALLAAPTEKPCTLTAEAAGSGPAVPESPSSAQREPVLFRVLRRSITPLLRLLKAANIP